jgi:hypothetical protein
MSINSIDNINNINNKENVKSEGGVALAIVMILLIIILILAVHSSESGSKSNLSSTTISVSLNRSIENKIENYGYKVTGFIGGKKKDEYFCYINGDVSVIKLSSTNILVNIYYDDLTLKNSFILNR